MIQFFARIKPILVAVCATLAMAVQAQKLAQFDLNNFDGWAYTRTGVDLNSDYICANKVNLYGKYMLVSPQFSVQRVKYVKVQARIVAKDFAQPKYSLAKASPTIELLDEQGNVVAAKKHAYGEPLSVQEFTDYIAVPEECKKVSMRISAPNADASSAGAVAELMLTASAVDGSKVVGDIDGDGVCDVTDATLLINIILDRSVTSDVADVNADGVVDVSDVTSLINLILK